MLRANTTDVSIAFGRRILDSLVLGERSQTASKYAMPLGDVSALPGFQPVTVERLEVPVDLDAAGEALDFDQIGNNKRRDPKQRQQIVQPAHTRAEPPLLNLGERRRGYPVALVLVELVGNFLKRPTELLPLPVEQPLDEASCLERRSGASSIGLLIEPVHTGYEENTKQGFKHPTEAPRPAPVRRQGLSASYQLRNPV